jgi:hypothetical protein
MGWFKRKKEIDPSTEAAAFRIADRILRVQRKVADGLNVWAGRFNRKTIVLMLLGLGLAFGCYCLWLVIGTLINSSIF